jgi:hypothetical protein
MGFSNAEDWRAKTDKPDRFRIAGAHEFSTSANSPTGGRKDAISRLSDESYNP